jgi:AraC family transcriptional regulator, transcriptional activator of pobA
MAEIETLEDFYRNKFAGVASDAQKAIGDFNAFVLEDISTPEGNSTVEYTRRDFFKISLITGTNLYHYADKTIKVEGTALAFFNPQVPYKMECAQKENKGFFCIFKEAFYSEKLRGNLNDLPMFAIGGKPCYILDEQQKEEVSMIFKKIIKEMGSDYKYKRDLLLNYVTEMIHYALKLEPTDGLFHTNDANTRITAVFSELLERQFPIVSSEQRFNMRSAKDFAERLFIHVNHLNRAIKETTGKTTSYYIANRIASEAKALLKHTDWNISEISYCLGFEEPSHFNNFFRKHTELSPSKYRTA